ncbi:MAG: 3-deoxy-7-phosphoheptulonate synthase [Pseudomonadota bacterium]
MIIQIKPDRVGSPEVAELCAFYETHPTEADGATLVITSGSVKGLDPKFLNLAERVHVTDGDMQLSDKRWLEGRSSTVNGLTVGDGTTTAMIAGPCAVEDREQIEKTADFLVGLGVKLFRAGAYKPRTSPYSFQGLGLEGLKILREVCDARGLAVVTEVRDATHAAEVLELADVAQIGAKAMYDHGVLKACGDSRKTILLKRGFGTTLKEFVQAAEFILSRGNPNVMLCERGIRTFETGTRFTLDLCGVAYVKEKTNLPVILDPSHAMGYRYGVSDLARACTAMGVDGLLIEVHPTPDKAKSDAAQQLTFEMFQALWESLPPVAAAVGRRIA